MTSHRENKMRSKKSKLKISNPPSIHPSSTSNSLHRLTSQKKEKIASQPPKVKLRLKLFSYCLGFAVSFFHFSGYFNIYLTF